MSEWPQYLQLPHTLLWIGVTIIFVGIIFLFAGILLALYRGA